MTEEQGQQPEAQEQQPIENTAQQQHEAAQPPTIPTTYLWQSIVVTILCCLPLGIPAIVFAAQVNSKVAAGDMAGAEEASRKARMWCWIAFGAGLAAVVISIILQVIFGVLAAAGASASGGM